MTNNNSFLQELEKIPKINIFMKQTKYSFEFEKLQVDYITLNLKNEKNNTRKITQFFNRYYCDKKDRTEK